jgi:dTMP kinase
MSKERGLFIVFEGLDKSGKSTQCNQLAQSLKKIGVPTELIRFPDRTTPIGKQIDSYLLKKIEMDDDKLHKLFSKNRWELDGTVESFLMQGKVVIADRYAYSGVAYSVAKGLDFDYCKRSDAGLIAPDIVFFLDISPENASKRSDYGEERYEKIQFQKSVRNYFKKLIDSTWVTLDSMKSKEQLSQFIQEKVSQLFLDCCDKQIRFLWNDQIKK